MKKIISLVAVTLLTLSSFSNADLYISDSKDYFRVIMGEIGSDDFLFFTVNSRHVRVYVRDENGNRFGCHAFPGEAMHDELKELSYALKAGDQVVMRRDGEECTYLSYAVFGDLNS